MEVRVNERVFAQIYAVTIENTTTNGCDNSYNGDKKKEQGGGDKPGIAAVILSSRGTPPPPALKMVWRRAS